MSGKPRGLRAELLAGEGACCLCPLMVWSLLVLFAHRIVGAGPDWKATRQHQARPGCGLASSGLVLGGNTLAEAQPDRFAPRRRVTNDGDGGAVQCSLRMADTGAARQSQPKAQAPSVWRGERLLLPFPAFDHLEDARAPHQQLVARPDLALDREDIVLPADDMAPCPRRSCPAWRRRGSRTSGGRSPTRCRRLSPPLRPRPCRRKS